MERTASSVEFLIAHLSDRKAILTDFVEHWTAHVNSGKEFKTQWQQFVKDARQVLKSLDCRVTCKSTLCL